jgi:hypothetical protein
MVQKVLEEKYGFYLSKTGINNILVRKFFLKGLLGRTRRGHAYIYFLNRGSQKQESQVPSSIVVVDAS